MTQELAEFTSFVIAWLITGFVLFLFSAIMIRIKKHDDWTDTFPLIIWVALSIALIFIGLFALLMNFIHAQLT